MPKRQKELLKPHIPNGPAHTLSALKGRRAQ